MKRSSKRAASLLGLFLAGAATLPSIADAAGPPGSGVTGEYVGTIGLNGGFSPRLDEIAANAGAPVAIEGDVLFAYDFLGPINITMSDGDMNGSWSMTGTGIVTGLFGAAGLSIGISGDGDFKGTGTVTGVPGSYLFDASFDSSVTVTIDNPVSGPVSSTQSGVDSFNATLTQVSVACDQISGRWDFEINQSLQEISFDAFLKGYFTAVSAPEEARAAIEELTKSINEWASRERDPGDQSSLWIDAFSILELAQLAIADLTAAGGCEPPCDFTTPLTHAAANTVLAAIADEPGSTTSYAVSLLLGSGSMSECDPAFADSLRTALVDDLELRIDDLVNRADSGEPGWQRNVIDAARTAQLLGLETFGTTGLAPSEVLVILGGE